MAPPENMRVTTPAGGSVSENSTASRLSTASLPAGFTWRHLQQLTRSKRSAERQRRSSGFVALGGKPVEAAERDHDALLLRPPDHIGDLDQGILQMGGHDLEVVPVEGDELHLVHGARSLPSDRILLLCGGNSEAAPAGASRKNNSSAPAFCRT